MKPILSICIPTYNRANILAETLSNILNSIMGFNEIEIIVSDNASSDSTKEIVKTFINKYPEIKYYRNEINIYELNYYTVVEKATGDYIWVFGDDDKILPGLIDKVIRYIKKDFNLIIANYSIWENDFNCIIKENIFNIKNDQLIYDKNILLTKLGLKLGFISCVIIKREDFLTISKNEYYNYVKYGFPFLLAIYTAVIKKCKVYIISDLILYQRGAVNNMSLDIWYKFFVEGSSQIFNNLRAKGYSQTAISKAKNHIIKEYVISDIFWRRKNKENIKGLFGVIFPYYRYNIIFWVVIPSILFFPLNLIVFLRKIIMRYRKLFNN